MTDYISFQMKDLVRETKLFIKNNPSLQQVFAVGQFNS